MNVGANRIVAGAAITAPLGLPDETPDKERSFRRKLVVNALELLGRKIEAQTMVQRSA